MGNQTGGRSERGGDSGGMKRISEPQQIEDAHEWRTQTEGLLKNLGELEQAPGTSSPDAIEDVGAKIGRLRTEEIPRLIKAIRDARNLMTYFPARDLMEQLLEQLKREMAGSVRRVDISPRREVELQAQYSASKTDTQRRAIGRELAELERNRKLGEATGIGEDGGIDEALSKKHREANERRKYQREVRKLKRSKSQEGA